MDYPLTRWKNATLLDAFLNVLAPLAPLGERGWG